MCQTIGYIKRTYISQPFCLYDAYPIAMDKKGFQRDASKIALLANQMETE